MMIAFDKVYRLYSYEYVFLTAEPRSAKLRRMSKAPTGFPLAVMDIEPSIDSGDGRAYVIVVVGSREFPDDVMNIQEWPLVVNISGIPTERAHEDELRMEDLDFFAIGLIEPEEFQGGWIKYIRRRRAGGQPNTDDG